MLLFFLSNNLFFFHLLGNFLYVVRCIFWETIADDVIFDFLCAYLAHHIVCASNCWIIYNSIMLILNKEIITIYVILLASLLRHQAIVIVFDFLPVSLFTTVKVVMSKLPNFVYENTELCRMS